MVKDRKLVDGFERRYSGETFRYAAHMIIFLSPAPEPDWASIMTAVGTVALAVMTLAAIITTIVISARDRRTTDKRLLRSAT